MPVVRDVCRHVRSKNAGPYWVTLDLFFAGEENFARYHQSPALGPATIRRLFDVDEEMVRHFAVPSLGVLKISFPRHSAQGGVVERDLHCGQQFIRLLDVELEPSPNPHGG